MVRSARPCEHARIIQGSGCVKKILVAAVILLVLDPVVVWLMGFATEQRVDGLADQAQLMVPQLHLVRKTRQGFLTSDEDATYELGSTLKLTRHYHRGWYSSVEESSLEISRAAYGALAAVGPASANIPAGGSGAAPFRVWLRTVIHHGPLCGWNCFALAGADTHVTVSGALQASLTRLFGDQEPLTISARFAFLGGGSAKISSPAFERAQLDPGVSLSWGGFDGTTHYGAHQDWYDMAATAPSLRLEGTKGTLQIEGMSLDLRGKRLLRTLYGGDSRMAVKRLSVAGTENTPQVAVNDLVIANQNDAKDGFMSVSYQLGGGTIATQSLTLSSAHLDLTWNHLALEPLESLFDALRAASQQQNTAVSPAARAQDMMTALKQPLEALLLQQPEMQIDRVSLATAQGQGQVTGLIRLAGVGAADFQGPPALLLKKLDVRLDLSIDEAFLQSLPGAAANALTQLQPMIDQGYITRSNGALRTQILVRGGQSTFNGKPFNPAALRPAGPAFPATPPPH
jgi:uncharacterized protein YdgA (DUF945 family)